ncbi:MAG: formylglycine-generating enzyme family protein [Marinilabiliaceae bacterium]|nr:formylglycine-generating enzyme family protein [Marinilabiliaceae bacterium]
MIITTKILKISVKFFFIIILLIKSFNLFGQEVTLFGSEICPDGIDLVYVAVLESDEKPFNSFYLGKFEVTQAQWRSVMGNNPSNFKNENHPVENVNWHDAQRFLERLNERTGRNYRLPTEAEWLHAARGDTISGYCPGSCRYSGSNEIDDVCWYIGNSNGRSKPVGSKNPNGFGIYDMSGNVWEWCEDQHKNNRGIRGGSWNSEARVCTVRYKYSYDATFRSFIIGFRVLLPVPVITTQD